MSLYLFTWPEAEREMNKFLLIRPEMNKKIVYQQYFSIRNASYLFPKGPEFT